MSTNPYRDLPDHQFWRRSVAAVEPFRFDPVVSTRFRIGKQERVATAGSCFAQHISSRLARIGFNYFITEPGDDGLTPAQRREQNYGVFSARFGNLYTTRQLLQLLQEAIDGRRAQEGVWQRDDGRFVDALRPQIDAAGFASPEQVVAERERHLVAVRRMFEDCEIFVFTLGLTEAWQSRLDGTVYPLAPGVAGGSFDPERHEFVNFDVLQVMADLEEFLRRLKELNPWVKAVLTVSPVPLIATFEPRNVLVSTTYSKSVLRVAAEMAWRRNDWVEYFPSYEIITGNYNDSAYFEADYRGINALGVDHAMRCFLAHYTENAEQPPSSPKPGAPPAAVPGAGSGIVCDEEVLDQTRI